MSYAVPPPVLAAGPHVFAHEIAGVRVFVKKNRRSKNILGKLAQRLLYALSGNILVLPPGYSREGSARHEARTLRELAARGVNVPAVLHVEDGYFVMSDVGETLERVLRDSPAEREYNIARAARELRRLHDLGFAHGGAQVKNLAVKDGAVYFLDFEELIPPEHLGEFQLRDLFLFLFSLERCGFDPDFSGVCAAYGGDERGATAAKMRRLIAGLRAARIFDWRVFDKLKIRDIRAVCALVRKAKNT